MQMTITSPATQAVFAYVRNHAIICFFIVACVPLAMLWPLSSEGVKKEEPPLARSRIPLFGHIFGFRRHHIKYLEILGRQTAQAPAYTMQILNKKLYVVTSAGMSQAVLRSRTLSFEPLAARIAGPLLGVSKEAVRTLGLDYDGHWIGSVGLTERRVDVSQKLSPGVDLSRMSTNTAQEVARIINRENSSWEVKDFSWWIRNMITYATAMGLYGPHSPVASDYDLVNDLWTFDSYGFFLTSNLFPSLLARKGLAARERLAKAFERYLEAGYDKEASSVVRSTIDIMHRHGISDSDHARLEIENLFVATVNTTPTALWLVINVLANQELFHKLREEVLNNIITELPSSTTKEGREHGQRGFQIDITRISTTCPLLYATYQEALRIGSIPTCNRVALEDTILTDPATEQSVLIQKGNRVIVPTYMLHSRQSTWGTDASTFSPYNFMDEPAATAKFAKRSSHHAHRKSRNESFVPYGGGVHLCPGRHFAQLEIFATAALMIVALDFESEDGGKIVVPDIAIGSGAMRPAKPMMVRTKRRQGWEDVEWSVKA